MSHSLLRRASLCAAILGVGALGQSYLRLINPSNGAPLRWASPSAISVVIHSTGSDDIDDDSHVTALRNAIDSWNAVEGTSARLVEDTNPTNMALGDYASSAHHVLRFDESNQSGYFPLGSSTVAITPVWFLSNGLITDADVLFNGQGCGFTTSGEFGYYDVQDVATHELGHLLGLDHSGQAGSSLYPYVDPRVILHRSLSRDDEQALRAIYPSGSHASFSGSVVRESDGTGVPGAQVVARDAAGRTCGGTVADSAGNFAIGGFDAGTYTLVALPLDAPVSGGNLSPGHVVVTNFEPRAAGPFTLSSGQAQAVGSLTVGSDVGLNLGTSSDRLPLRATRGALTNHTLTGSGLAPGSTLTASDPDVVVQVLAWSYSSVSFRLDVGGSEAPGHFDLTVTNSSGDVSVLPAAVEITPPDPSVAAVSPAQQDKSSSAPLSIFGANFRAGCRVVIAGEIYEEGVPGGCSLISPGQLDLTTRPSAPGTWDVVVIDPTGVEGRLASAYQFTTIPQVSSVFPSAGDDAGGTLVTIKGQEFTGDTTVWIGGVLQSTVAVVDSRTIQLLTQPGVAGGPYELRVANPGGAIATADFSYVSPPDPDVFRIDPGGGSATGGEEIRIDGANFAADTRVVFGADPETGLGGFEAPEVRVVSSTQLAVRTPQVGFNAPLSVLAETTSTGQASVVPAAFTTSGADGGGGGCQAVVVPGPPDAGDVLRSVLFFALLALGSRLVRPRPRPVAA
ncbi:MAG: IPT/TIG domain-containing protein [Planctomycetes bacterium]|nr:IPT/TIG domain-containing protein [Planctomycetota bacterium]MCB9903319.1 IPT/TIG domain-containing protein [Planctomycetota bacterium]